MRRPLLGDVRRVDPLADECRLVLYSLVHDSVVIGSSFWRPTAKDSKLSPESPSPVRSRGRSRNQGKQAGPSSRFWVRVSSKVALCQLAGGFQTGWTSPSSLG